MGKLPEEVIEDILSRLPVKSLLRFKCVSKSWLGLITNPNFASKHLIHQPKDDLFVGRYCPEQGNVFYFLSRSGNVDNNDFSWVEDFTFTLNFESTAGDDGDEDSHHDFRTLEMHGHCDGIVAVSNFNRVVLLNPSIREFRLLPDSRSYPFGQSQKGFHVRRNGVGFGYDPKTDDYKVVRVVTLFGLTRKISKAEVFSLRGSSTWREINNAEISGAGFFRANDLEQFFDGVYYWRGRDYITEEPILVSFDMVDEVFGRAPLPDFCDFNIRDDDNLTISLGVFNNESIALFVTSRVRVERVETCIEVWVMKEFSLKDFWTKQLTIGPLQGLERPLVFWKNNKELLHVDESWELIFYNLAALERSDLPIRCEMQDYESWTAATYRKTLVSFNASRDSQLDTISINWVELNKNPECPNPLLQRRSRAGRWF